MAGVGGNVIRATLRILAPKLNIDGATGYVA